MIMNSYNKRQPDALFLKFILIKENSTCLGQIYCPSSEVLKLYSQYLVFVILVLLTDCWRGQNGTPSWLCQQLTHVAWQMLLRIQCWHAWWWTVNMSETCKVLYQNKLGEQCIFLPFIIRIYITMHGPLNFKLILSHFSKTRNFWTERKRESVFKHLLNVA